MKNILLQTKIDSINSALPSTDSTSFSIWFWIALVEFAIIILLFLKSKKKQNIKKPKIIMDNVMDDIHKSKGLYKELGKKCHPDRFQDEELKIKALKLFQDISENKSNFKKLVELKERAITELNINFK